MCLETIKDVKEIGGFEVAHLGIGKDGLRNLGHITIDHTNNYICFWLQNGPIKEVGVNGAQVDCLIEAAKLIIEGFDKTYPCDENKYVIEHLHKALDWLYDRKVNRAARGVEGR